MFLEKNRDRIEKDFEDFSRELPGKAEEIKKRMEALSRKYCDRNEISVQQYALQRCGKLYL